MPLIVTELVLPANVAEVRSADLDDDGRAELIAVSHIKAPGQPDAVSLTIIHLDAEGVEEGRQQLDLGRRATMWDPDSGGLYTITGKGVSRIEANGVVTELAQLTTPLAVVGSTTPQAADIAHDLDGDGDTEVLAYSQGRFHAVASHGGVYGSVPARARGSLSSTTLAGGTSLAVTAVMPSLVVGDIDGDGRKDLALPAGLGLTVHFTADQIGARTAQLDLPRDLKPENPDDQDDKGPKVRLRSSWFSDMDGDGKLDLVTHDAITDGSWFGSTAALSVYLGTGTAFLRPQVIETHAAAFGVQVIDWEGDGDLDLLVPQVDVSMGNLARALVARKVEVDAWLYRMTDGRLSTEPVMLGSVLVPIENPDQVHAMVESDLTGDGVLDLVTDRGEDQVEVFAGRRSPVRGHGFSEEPIATASIVVPDVEGSMVLRDYTGDGRAEILIWRPGSTHATLLRLVL